MLLIVKPTYDCNSKCRYCVYPGKGRRRRMDGKTLSLIEKRILEYRQETGAEAVSFLWHGGEPLLMGDDFFASVEEMTCRLESRMRVQHLIQTNLTLLSEHEFPAVVRLMKKYQAVSTSFDPIDGIRELARQGEYRKDWLRAFFRLKNEGIQPNAVYVVHRRSLEAPGKILHFFRNLGVRGLRINPVAIHSSGERPKGGDLAITAHEYADFLISAWHTWHSEMREFPVEPFLSWASMNSAGIKPNACAMNGKCALNTLCIDPQGNVYNCGRHIDCDLGRLGHIASASLFDLDKCRNPVTRAGNLRQGHCAECRWWDYCHGGCPMDPASIGLPPESATVWCDSYRLFFEKIFDKESSG